ncbi:Uncharacterized protein GBIM_07113 [Gryllus bimaculatus]|nr:Uncharacterized protein GBIM_07113 [Gryllus bimaculatus]
MIGGPVPPGAGPCGSRADPPEITLRPRDQQVKAGGVAAFYCQARGDPQPTLQWRKNGKRVSSTQSRYLVHEFPQGGALLRIEPVRAGRDDAAYECVAENGVGDAVSAEAILTVYETTCSAAGVAVRFGPCRCRGKQAAWPVAVALRRCPLPWQWLVIIVDVGPVPAAPSACRRLLCVRTSPRHPAPAARRPA